MVDENAMLDEIFAKVGQSAGIIDLRELFADAQGRVSVFQDRPPLDAQRGAYRAYEAFCAQKGLTPFDRDAHESATVTGFEGTHYSATRLWNVRMTRSPTTRLTTSDDGLPDHRRGRL